MFKNKSTGGMFITEIIFKQALIGSNVFALNSESHIDIYCVTKNNELIGFASNPHNGFNYIRTQLISRKSPIHNICGVRNNDNFHLYFLEDGSLKHTNPANTNKWAHDL